MKYRQLTKKEILQHLSYSPDTGTFTWLSNPEKRKCWNSKFAGKHAGSVNKGILIISLCLGGITFKIPVIHLVWFIEKGEWCTGRLAHIDGDSLNNRIENITEQSKPHKPVKHTNKKQGQRGIRQRGNKWEARLGNSYIGLYDTQLEAITARKNKGG